MIEEKPLIFKLKIIVYGREFDSSKSHSFVVDDMQMGPSSPIGEFVLNIKEANLKDLRPKIEYNRSNNMLKRSLLFQEALFIMQRLPNHYKKPKEDITRYQWGFYNRKTNHLQLIDLEREHLAIADLIESYIDFFDYELAIVPATQIP